MRSYPYLAAFAAFVLVCLVAGCSLGHVDQYGTYQVHTEHYVTSDGVRVECLLIRTSKGTASLNCDWDHATRP